MKHKYVGVVLLLAVLMTNIIVTQYMVHQYFYEHYKNSMLAAIVNAVLFFVAFLIYKMDKKGMSANE
ncbi:MAG TPA: hypothetical protein VJ546_09940 [Bacillales bacterium]|nr:hypothetical protein [Bacillales bacterium]